MGSSDTVVVMSKLTVKLLTIEIIYSPSYTKPNIGFCIFNHHRVFNLGQNFKVLIATELQ